LPAELEARLQTGGSPRADEANVLGAAFDAYVAEVIEMVRLEPAAASA